MNRNPNARRRHPMLLLLAAAALPAMSRAAPPAIALPTTVVTASRSDTGGEETRAELATVNGGVNLVTRESVERTPLLGLHDMLRGAVGVDTSPRTAVDGTAVSIRGSGLNDKTGNGRGIAVIQDGAPVNQADGLMELSPVDPDALDSVEIRRGGNALRYGANALGGAMILRSSTGRTAPGARLLGMAGSFGYAKGFASFGADTGRLDAFGAYSYARTDGYRDHAASDAHRVNVNLGAELAKGVENRVFAGFTDYRAETPGDVTKAALEHNPRSADPDALLFDTYRAYKLARLSDTVSFFNDHTRFDLTAGGYYRDLDEHGAGPGDATDKVTVIGSLAGALRHDDELAGRRCASTLGFNLSAGTVDDNRFDALPGTATRGARDQSSDQKAQTAELFGEHDQYLTRRDAITIGAQGLWTRRSLDYTFGRPDTEDREKQYLGFNPKLGARHEFDPRNTVFANVSRSFEAPTFAQFKTGRGSQPSNLNAQTARTAEIGTRGEHRRWSWEIVPYHAWVENEFLNYSTGASATQFTTLNAGDTVHRGVEMGVSVELFSELPEGASIGDGAPRNRILFNNTGNLADHRFVNDAAYGDNRLPGASVYRHRAELMLELKNGFHFGPNLEIGTETYADSANTLRAPAYVTLNLRSGYRWNKTGRVFLEARNLTDEHYSPMVTSLANANGADQAVFRPADGPSVYAGLELRF